MIKYKNNYVNLVVLGSFNPGILTHEFLTKVCNFNFGVEPKTQHVPVVTSLEYGNVAFFADLGRLQISENGCVAPEKSLISQYLRTYLDKLPYTPLKKCGANFSYELSVDEAKLTSVHTWLKSSRKSILESLEVPEIGLDVSFDVGKDSERIKSWTVKTKIAKAKATTMTKFHYGKNGRTVNVDFNYEVDNLDKDRNLLDAITSNYCDIYNIFKRQIERIFGS